MCHLSICYMSLYSLIILISTFYSHLRCNIKQQYTQKHGNIFSIWYENSYEILWTRIDIRTFVITVRTIRILRLYTYSFATSKWKIHYGDDDPYSKTLSNVRSQSTSFIAGTDSQHLHSQGAFFNLSFLNKYTF